MPFPTSEDFHALTLLSDPSKISDDTQLASIMASMRTPIGRPEENLAFGPRSSRTPATLVALDLLHRANSARAKGTTLSAPVFDELWELKGEKATAEQMKSLMAGGDKAEGVRSEVRSSRDGTGRGFRKRPSDETLRQMRAYYTEIHNPSKQPQANQVPYQFSKRTPTKQYTTGPIPAVSASDAISDATSECTDFSR